MATICQTLSSETDNLWSYTIDGVKNINKGIDFIYPYILNKDNWPFARDVMYWDEWPVAHPFLILELCKQIIKIGLLLGAIWSIFQPRMK